MNGPRMGHLDPLRGMPSATHQLLFVQFSRDGTHTYLLVVFDSYQQINAFGPYYSPSIYPSNEWCRLSYSPQLWFKNNIHVTRVSQFICFICPNGINGDQKDHAWPGPQRREKKKKGRQNEISTTCWLFLKCKVTNGSRKVHGVRMAFACCSFRSSCGSYKEHETYAMGFIH